MDDLLFGFSRKLYSQWSNKLPDLLDPFGLYLQNLKKTTFTSVILWDVLPWGGHTQAKATHSTCAGLNLDIVVVRTYSLRIKQGMKAVLVPGHEKVHPIVRGLKIDEDFPSFYRANGDAWGSNMNLMIPFIIFPLYSSLKSMTGTPKQEWKFQLVGGSLLKKKGPPDNLQDPQGHGILLIVSLIYEGMLLRLSEWGQHEGMANAISSLEYCLTSTIV